MQQASSAVEDGEVESDNGGFQNLWDWRRRIADLYAAVRAEPDPRRAWEHWRAERDHLFATHPQSALEPDARARFERLPFYDYDPSLRFGVDTTPIQAPPAVFEAGRDGDLRMQPFARTKGLADRLGAELTLFWITGYGGGVFLPFTDATSRHETYGAGRYLLDTIKSADLGPDRAGRLILDFNFAYNPSCCYSARYICPLPPVSNRLPRAVRAGEKAPVS